MEKDKFESFGTVRVAYLTTEQQLLVKADSHDDSLSHIFVTGDQIGSMILLHVISSAKVRYPNLVYFVLFMEHEDRSGKRYFLLNLSEDSVVANLTVSTSKTESDVGVVIINKSEIVCIYNDRRKSPYRLSADIFSEEGVNGRHVATLSDM